MEFKEYDWLFSKNVYFFINLENNYVRAVGKNLISEAWSYRLIKKFIENNLVMRGIDGRKKNIILTDKGEKIKNDLKKILEILRGEQNV